MVGIAGRPKRCSGAKMGVAGKIMGVFITTFLVRLYSGPNGWLMSFLYWYKSRLFGMGGRLGFFGCFFSWTLRLLFFLSPFLFITNQHTFTESRIFRTCPKGSLFFAAICFLMGLFSHYPLFVFSSHSAFGIGRAGSVFPSCMLYRRPAFVV